MSQKEVDRALFLNQVKEKQITLKRASELLRLSYPQTKRLWARFKQYGPQGLISKKRGRQSNRAVSDEKRKEIVRIINANYYECKPRFISEKLVQYHDIKYSAEFIRQVMIEYKLWFPRTRSEKVYQRRERKESEGEMLQGDASEHAWFEERGPNCHLHLFVDDATGSIGGGHFCPEETTEGYYKALMPILETKGRPISVYTDKRGTFIVNQGKKRGKTQFARAMQELGINMILAHSPQAKGRIERTFGTLQERLIWEMRIHQINTLEEANEFLPRFLEEYNKQFAVAPRNPINAYRPLNQHTNLKYILCTKEIRKVTKNLEIQYNNHIYQLMPPKNLRARLKGANVAVITTLENDLLFEYEGVFLEYKRYYELEYQEPAICRDSLLANWKDVRGRKSKPDKHHPWKKNRRAA
jgi:predicted DNA-binding protein with PD1-like motif